MVSDYWLPLNRHREHDHFNITDKHIGVFHVTSKPQEARCAEYNYTTKSYRDEYRCLFAFKVNPLSSDSAHIPVLSNSRHFHPESYLNVVRATSTTGLLKIIIISRLVGIMNCDNALLAPCLTVETFYYLGGSYHTAHWNFLIKGKSDKNDKRAVRDLDHTGSFQLSL